MSNDATDGFDMNHEFDWGKREVPDGASFLYFECHYCDTQVVMSPGSHIGEYYPTLYCGQCDNGPPLDRIAIEMPDGIHYKPGYDGDVKLWEDDDE